MSRLEILKHFWKAENKSKGVYRFEKQKRKKTGMFTLVGPQGFTRQPLPFRPVKTHAFPAPCKPKASAKTSIPTCSPSSLPWEDPLCEAWETEKYTPYNNYDTYFFLIWPLTCCLSASSGIFSILLSNRISEWTRTE